MARGGCRVGAGRPKIKEEHLRKVQLSISVTHQTREWLRTQSEIRGVTMGKILEELISSQI